VTDTAPQQTEAEAMRAAVREELDEVVPHLIAALKRNDGVADLVRRLDDAERRLAARDQRPIVSRLYRLVGLVRRLDLPDEVREMLLEELLDVLRGAGYGEFGVAGEPFDPARHQALDADAIDGTAVVADVYEPGLETLGEVVVPARVRVGGEVPEDHTTEEAEQ
jgi:hypothetical protein